MKPWLNFFISWNCNVWLLDLERAWPKSKIKASVFTRIKVVGKSFFMDSMTCFFFHNLLFKNLLKNKFKKESLVIKRQMLNFAGSKNFISFGPQIREQMSGPKIS